MPRGDGTGPMGMGSMTGRAAGFCAGYNAPGYMNSVPGRGYGAGFGRGFGMVGGFGRRNRYFAAGPVGWAQQPAWGGAPATPAQQLDALKSQAEYFEDSLKNIRQQIEEVEARK